MPTIPVGLGHDRLEQHPAPWTRRSVYHAAWVEVIAAAWASRGVRCVAVPADEPFGVVAAGELSHGLT